MSTCIEEPPNERKLPSRVLFKSLSLKLTTGDQVFTFKIICGFEPQKRIRNFLDLLLVRLQSGKCKTNYSGEPVRIV